MISPSVLAYIPDPFAVRESQYLVREREGARVLSPAELSDYSMPVMAADTPALVDDLRRLNLPPPKRLLDIGDALKLSVGQSRDDGGEKRWNVWPSLSRRFNWPDDAEKFRLIFLSRIGRPDGQEVARLLGEALHAMERLWIDLEVRLTKVGEYRRLVEVEWPLQSLFAFRQYRGIRLDADHAPKLLEKISFEKYSSYRTVADLLGRSPTDLNFRNIVPFLAQTDVGGLSDIEPGGRMQDAFELAASRSKFASAFCNMVKASRDETIVRRALGGDDRIFPIFSVMGTVSGRILVSDPYLQQLRRAYRSVVAPEPGMRLAYLDYAQFEPGVLAALAGDQSLISAYNKGDVYTALSTELFGDAAMRPFAKRVFLAFSYGMSPERIATMVASSGSRTEQADVAKKIAEFFSKYPKLEEYRVAQEARLLADGYVSSVLGNRRVRTGSGTLSHKERRWALNQPVQSTASLIFKEALIEIEKVFGREAVLLPVHDAVLMQFPDDDSFEGATRLASEMMEAAFHRRFPEVKSRVTIGSFAE